MNKKNILYIAGITVLLVAVVVTYYYLYQDPQQTTVKQRELKTSDLPKEYGIISSQKHSK